MRSDMSKVICERPRRKSPMGKLLLRANRRQARRDPEGTPAYRSMKLVHAVDGCGWWLKEHGEHLSPLMRWLCKAVGRVWNDVYSELCQRLDCRSTVQRHVLFHADGYVDRHVLIIDGVPHMQMGRGTPIELFEGSLFIDPRNGLLCQHKRMN